MLGLKRHKKVGWVVYCKACGRPIPTELHRETLEELPDGQAYQCTMCGETMTYNRNEHEPVSA